LFPDGGRAEVVLVCGFWWYLKTAYYRKTWESIGKARGGEKSPTDKPRDTARPYLQGIFAEIPLFYGES
jgi:hypothetical protein